MKRKNKEERERGREARSKDYGDVRSMEKNGGGRITRREKGKEQGVKE